MIASSGSDPGEAGVRPPRAVSSARKPAAATTTTATAFAFAAKAAGWAPTAASAATAAATVATATASVATAEQVHRCHGRVGLTACATTRLVAERVHTALRAQMGIGAGLEIVFKMLGGLRIKVMRCASGCAGTGATVIAVATGLVATACVVGSAVGIGRAGRAVPSGLWTRPG